VLVIVGRGPPRVAKDDRKASASWSESAACFGRGTVEFARRRLAALSALLGDKPDLDGDRFTAGNLITMTVLRILKHTGIVASEKRLAVHIERCTVRPPSNRMSAISETPRERWREPISERHRSLKTFGRAMPLALTPQVPLHPGMPRLQAKNVVQRRSFGPLVSAVAIGILTELLSLVD